MEIYHLVFYQQLLHQLHLHLVCAWRSLAEDLPTLTVNVVSVTAVIANLLL